MGASPKDKRTPPAKKFEDYVLTYEVGPSANLYPISNEQLKYVEGNLGRPGYDDSGDYFDIGFTFPFENKKYTKIYLNTNCVCCLVDPDHPLPGFIMSDVGSGGMVDNGALFDVFLKEHLVLAPWWDDVRTIWRTLNDPGAGGGATPDAYLTALGYSDLTETKRGMLAGKILYPPGIDSTMGGVKYARCEGSQGKFLVLRWKFFTFWSMPKNIAFLDLVLYENGCIEFRYSPRIVSGDVSSFESATCGIFAYGGATGKPRYRDFGGLIRPDSRGQYINGGAVYDGAYTDSDLTYGGTSKYSVSLSATKNWPGLGQFGAIFRFSPPQNRRRQNRSNLQLRDNVPFVQEGLSYFDDQKTVNNSVAGENLRVEYPSMVPIDSKLVSLGDPTSIKDLHQSGSIQVARTNIRPGLYDSVLQDSILSGRRFK